MILSKIKQIYHWQDTWGKKCFLQFLSKFVLSCCFDLLKKELKINFQTLFSPSFDSSPMVYMNHTELMLQDLLLYCTKKVPKNHNYFCHFRHGLKHTSWCLLRP